MDAKRKRRSDGWYVGTNNDDERMVVVSLLFSSSLLLSLLSLMGVKALLFILESRDDGPIWGQMISSLTLLLLLLLLGGYRIRPGRVKMIWTKFLIWILFNNRRRICWYIVAVDDNTSFLSKPVSLKLGALLSSFSMILLRLSVLNSHREDDDGTDDDDDEDDDNNCEWISSSSSSTTLNANCDVRSRISL